MPRIQTIEDALGLILDWADRKDLKIPPREQSASYPDALPLVVSVSDQLGADFASSHGVDSPLLSLQDTTLRPEDVRLKDAARILIVENQGCWISGFREDDPKALLVSGDWGDLISSTARQDWHAVDATTEDALILTVLVNGIFTLCELLQEETSNDFNHIPPETDVLLWRHSAWGDWPGFWTDAEGTRLHFGGMGLTLRR